MSKLSKLLIIVLMGAFLTACQLSEPKMFGIPQSQWNQLTPKQQNQVIRAYNQRKNIETMNRPWENAIDTAGMLARH